MATGGSISIISWSIILPRTKKAGFTSRKNKIAAERTGTHLFELKKAS